MKHMHEIKERAIFTRITTCNKLDLEHSLANLVLEEYGVKDAHVHCLWSDRGTERWCSQARRQEVLK